MKKTKTGIPNLKHNTNLATNEYVVQYILFLFRVL